MSSLQEPKVLKYWFLVEHLRRQIADGRLQPGARVPSLAQMQAEFRVSRATVEKAYDLLERDGLLMREQGRGTFVAEPAARNATQVLGLLLRIDPRIDFYIMELLTGIRRETTRQGMNLLWLDETKTPDCSAMDALLMLCHPSEALAFNLPAQLPHALLFHHSPDFTCVAADDFAGAKLATQHLLELGHRRIAYLLASDSDSISRCRLAGYQAALKGAGVPFDKNLVRFLREPRRYGYQNSAQITLQEWLAENRRGLEWTAILAHNDEAAIGAGEVLRARGVRVPEDVSVVGFDGTELSAMSTPALTTIKVPLQEIGAAAVKVLRAQIGGEVSSEPKKIVLPVQFQLGASTAPVQSIHEAFVSFPN